MSVVFPAPLGPRYPKAHPRGTSSSTSSTATLASKRLVSPWVSTAHWLSPRRVGESAKVAVIRPALLVVEARVAGIPFCPVYPV